MSYNMVFMCVASIVNLVNARQRMVTCLSKWCSHLCFRAARALVGFSGVRVPCDNTHPLTASVQWRTGKTIWLQAMYAHQYTVVQDDRGIREMVTAT